MAVYSTREETVTSWWQ